MAQVEQENNQKISLQDIADGALNPVDYSRLKSNFPTQIIAKELRSAVEHGQLNVTRYDQLRPRIDLTSSDKQFINCVYSGLGNSGIMEVTDWTLDRVYATRRKVYRSLGLSTDQELVVWEAVRKTRERSHD